MRKTLFVMIALATSALGCTGACNGLLSGKVRSEREDAPKDLAVEAELDQIAAEL